MPTAQRGRSAFGRATSPRSPPRRSWEWTGCPLPRPRPLRARRRPQSAPEERSSRRWTRGSARRPARSSHCGSVARGRASRGWYSHECSLAFRRGGREEQWPARRSRTEPRCATRERAPAARGTARAAAADALPVAWRKSQRATRERRRRSHMSAGSAASATPIPPEALSLESLQTIVSESPRFSIKSF